MSLIITTELWPSGGIALLPHCMVEGTPCATIAVLDPDKQPTMSQSAAAEAHFALPILTTRTT